MIVCIGQCEAIDLVPTEDDADAVRCSNMGVRIRETVGDIGGNGYARIRFVCPVHGYEPGMGLEYDENESTRPIR